MKKKKAANVILVDDNQLAMKLLQEMLAEENFKLTCFDSATAAMPHIEANKNKIDLIITDIEMPGMNGFEFCKKVLSIKELTHTPFIMVSSKCDSATITEGYEAGCFEFIPKPVEKETLLRKCHHAVKQHRNLKKFHKSMTAAKDAAFSAMTSGNQLASIITLTEKSDEIATLDQLAEAVFEILDKFGLQTSLLFKVNYECKNYFCSNNYEQPLEKRTLMTMGKTDKWTKGERFYDFNDRLFVIFEKVILLIKNPSAAKNQDNRDFLASLMNFVETKTKHIEIEETRDIEKQKEYQEMADKFEDSINDIKKIFDSQMEGLADVTQLKFSELNVKFSALDLGDSNDQVITETVSDTMSVLEKRIEDGRKTMEMVISGLINDINHVLTIDDKNGKSGDQASGDDNLQATNG